MLQKHPVLVPKFRHFRELFRFPVGNLTNSRLLKWSSILVSSLNVILSQASVSNISYEQIKFAFKLLFKFKAGISVEICKMCMKDTFRSIYWHQSYEVPVLHLSCSILWLSFDCPYLFPYDPILQLTWLTTYESIRNISKLQEDAASWNSESQRYCSYCHLHYVRSGLWKFSSWFQAMK